MTDLHCHILPCIDDGAQDLETAVELLRKERADGVRNIIFTSHFNYERTALQHFIAKRQEVFEKLLMTLGEEAKDFNFQLGAEVFFSPGLCELDIRKLCLGDTDYMLIEFPTSHKPHFIRHTLYKIQSQGIIPIIAHVERYPYVMKDLAILYDWVAAGAYAQVNADSILLKRKNAGLILKLIKWNLVHIIATDAHSLAGRSPQMKLAFHIVEKKAGRDISEKLQKNANDIFLNLDPDVEKPHSPRKFLNVWI